MYFYHWSFRRYSVPWRCFLSTLDDFLAHLSTKCSGWAIVTGLCPSFVARRSSIFLLKRLLLWNRFMDFDQTSQDWSLGSPLPKLFKWFSLVASVGHWTKKGFQNAIFKNLLVWNYKAQSFHIWYVASSSGPLPKLFKLCPWGHNWPRPGGGSQFNIELYKETFKRHLLLNR